MSGLETALVFILLFGGLCFIPAAMWWIDDHLTEQRERRRRANDSPTLLDLLGLFAKLPDEEQKAELKELRQRVAERKAGKGKHHG